MNPATVLAVLQTAAALEPLIADLIPLIEKGFAGEAYNDTDLAMLESAAAAIDKAVAEKEASIAPGA